MHVLLQLESISFLFFIIDPALLKNASWKLLVEVFLIFDQFVFAASNREPTRLFHLSFDLGLRSPYPFQWGMGANSIVDNQ